MGLCIANGVRARAHLLIPLGSLFFLFFIINFVFVVVACLLYALLTWLCP